MPFWGQSRLELDLDDAVRSCMKVATRFEVVPLGSGGKIEPIDTLFGGSPYAEEGDTWPILYGRPMDFVAQFNLRQCLDPPPLPYQLITVFVSWHALETDKALQDESHGCFIRSYSDPNSAKRITLERPTPCQGGDYRVVSCRTKATRLFSYPSSVRSFLKVAVIERLVCRFSDPYDAYKRSLKRIGYQQVEATFVGGYPTWVHNNALDDDGLVFVAQIGHEPLAGFCIGDGAPLFIAAHKSDPVRFELDPFQTH